MTTKEFQDIVWGYYQQYGRHHLPWRNSPSPYQVLVSEMMLQQTQVERVTPKFQEFMQTFPNIETLAQAPLGDVLNAWQGLGYNRRAKYLHEAAKMIFQKGHFPADAAELTTLPGVGKNTAGALLAYAFNQPVVYVETNIRTVFLHHYFTDQAAVSDGELLEVVADTLPTKNIREWYSALMDYGTYLKSQGAGNISRSKQYKKQSQFSGSVRQLRGAVIRELSKGGQTVDTLSAAVSDDRLGDVILQLEQEGLVVRTEGVYGLPAM